MYAGSVVIINPAQVHACNPVDVLHPYGHDEQQFMLTQASQEQQDRKTAKPKVAPLTCARLARKPY